MEKSGYRCAKCSKQVLHRRQLTKWGNQYWCEHCVQDHIASFKKKPMNALEQAWNELQAVPSYVERKLDPEIQERPEDSTEYLQDLNGHNQEVLWERMEEATMPSDAEIEYLAEMAIEGE